MSLENEIYLPEVFLFDVDMTQKRVYILCTVPYRENCDFYSLILEDSIAFYLSLFINLLKYIEDTAHFFSMRIAHSATLTEDQKRPLTIE